MRKVLVIGASGLLGQYVAMEARSMGCDVVGTYNENSGPGGVRMDVTDHGAVSQVIGDEMPGTVVLCAAMTNVDQCEREPNRAYDINMEGALNVASACRDSRAKMVYISTDYVFNGLKGGRYHEFETPDPLSVYARSKLEGERVTLDSGKGNLVCRVSVVYGWNRTSGKGNFVTWIIDSLREERPIRLYHDQYVSPTYAPAAAKCVLELAARGAKGIMHTSGPDCLSRYQIGLAVAEAFGLDDSLITPVSTEEMPLTAKRPPRSCLATDLVEAELDRRMTNLREGLELMRKEGA